MGGEEFLIILPNTHIDLAYIIDEKLTSINELKMKTPNGDYAKVTLSLGVHQIDYNNLIYKEFTILDKCLYLAKEKRNNTIKSTQMMCKL